MSNKHYRPLPGHLMLILGVSSFLFAAYGPTFYTKYAMLSIIITFLIIFGFMIIGPDKQRIIMVNGKPMGVIDAPGFYWVHPFAEYKEYPSRNISYNQTCSARATDGNSLPVDVEGVLSCRIIDPCAWHFKVANPMVYVRHVFWDAVKDIMPRYVLDNFEGREDTLCLAKSRESFSKEVAEYVNERVSLVGIEVNEIRYSKIAYACEVNAMVMERLHGQFIVEGCKERIDEAVALINGAIEELQRKSTESGVYLTPDKKGQLASALMVELLGTHNYKSYK